VAVAVLTNVLLFCQNSLGSGLPIEQAQREYQARYHYLWQSGKFFCYYPPCPNSAPYVKWPNCRSGTPAPNFPPDGFYGDVASDPDFAVILVSDLAGKFYGDAIYPYFVSAIEGLDHIAHFTSADMGDEPVVTTANYAGVLNAILAKTEQLKKIDFHCDSAGTTTLYGDSGLVTDNCDDVRDAASSALAGVDGTLLAALGSVESTTQIRPGSWGAYLIESAGVLTGDLSKCPVTPTLYLQLAVLGQGGVAIVRLQRMVNSTLPA